MALKSKIKEIEFTFCTQGRTADMPDIKNVDGVIQVQGVYLIDQTDVPGAVQQLIEKTL